MGCGRRVPGHGQCHQDGQHAETETEMLASVVEHFHSPKGYALFVNIAVFSRLSCVQQLMQW